MISLMISAYLFLGIGWFIFWLYWIVSAAQSKKTIHNSRWFRGIGIRVIIFILVIWFLGGTGLGQFLNVPGSYYFNNSVILDVVAIIVWCAGIGLAVWARIYLGKNWGMPMSLKESPELVTAGPYRYVRNPIYSGVLLAMLATAFVGDLFWLIPFVFFGIYFIYASRVEEKIMTREFPDTYPAYKKRTKMLVPFVF